MGSEMGRKRTSQIIVQELLLCFRVTDIQFMIHMAFCKFLLYNDKYKTNEWREYTYEKKETKETEEI